MAILYIAATPIGNLKDISQRVLDVFQEVDLILCEDTRTTKKILNYYQIDRPTMAYHQHSKLAKAEEILKRLKEGKRLVLVSDAGTPAISDPGAKLISYLVAQMPSLKVVPLPGPSALTAALSIAGLPADKFIFLGFPPSKKKRKKFFQEAASQKYTVVFYESCHRILKTLYDFELASNPLGGNFKVVVCRELTKKFESVYRGSFKEVIAKIEKDERKGEFVIIAKRNE